MPSLPRELSEAKSYAERLFTYHRVEHLSGQVAQEALTRPAALEGVEWDPDAVDYVVTDTRGYPYFLQEYGQATWTVANGDRLTLTDARVGGARGLASLDDGFFRSRWDRATNSERQYLTAMAPDGDAGSSSSAVATRLKKKPQSLGPIRAGLIQKGMVWSTRRNRASSPSPSPEWPTSSAARSPIDSSGIKRPGTGSSRPRRRCRSVQTPIGPRRRLSPS